MLETQLVVIWHQTNIYPALSSFQQHFYPLLSFTYFSSPIQWKTIRLQEYTDLMQLKPKIQSLENTIRAQQIELHECINVSHLSDVNYPLDKSIYLHIWALFSINQYLIFVFPCHCVHASTYCWRRIVYMLPYSDLLINISPHNK